MKNYFLSFILIALFSSCSDNTSNEVFVKTVKELNDAISYATAGSQIVLANGTWTDIQIKLYGHGTKKAPITLKAETAGSVFIEGKSYLHLGGEYLVVDGLYFRNGYAPESGVIRYQIGKDSTAFHSRVTNTVIDGFTRPNRWENDRWVELYGQHNQFDHNYVAGKGNDGATFMIYHKGNQHTNNYHKIEYNHFGPRPRKGGPRGETFRLGGSANNFFDRCNGEVEIISDKTNFNRFLNNIFYKCEGSLVMRHSDYTTVDGNLFIGDDDSDFYGGIRVINSGHWITNNYFYKIKGEEFRSPLAVMNGIPKSSLNRYKQVTDAVVAYNTWVDCASPFQIGVGQNKASKDVLPKSEIRSAPPIRTVLANNIIYNSTVDPAPVVNHDDMRGVQFENNVIFNAGDPTDEFKIFKHVSIVMEQINDWLFVPAEGTNELLDEVYHGFDFERISQDVFGADRSNKNRIGAVANSVKAKSFKFEKSKYGPSWFNTDTEKSVPSIHKISAIDGALESALKKAAAGDVLLLNDGEYSFAKSLTIDKAILIKAAKGGKVSLNYTGEAGSAAFNMSPLSRLELDGINLKGEGSQMAFAPLKENMSSSYKLFVKNSKVQNFDHILLASRGSFADSIGVDKTTFIDAKNGFVLAADQKGDYNAEMFSISNSSFENIDQKNPWYHKCINRRQYFYQ